MYAEPAITRAVQAEHNLYARIEAEFGLLTSTEAGKHMGSRVAGLPRNFAATAHRNDQLVAVRRGNQLCLSGVSSSGRTGSRSPLIGRLRETAASQ